MTASENPNVQTTAEGEEVVLEPGDPGYVAPTAEQEGEVLSPELPVAQEVGPEPTSGGQDLTIKNEPGQDSSEAILMARGTVVESTSPTDIVPNTPQIRPFPTETEAVVEEVPPEVEGEAEAEPASA